MKTPAAKRKRRQSSSPRTRKASRQPMKGSDILVKALEEVGVEVLFAYPGGASMPIHQSLTRSKKIRTILPRHEQGGVFAAEGYARVTGKAGVCMATSGPGATNLITGIADAFLDSTPIVAITGQVKQEMIGRGAFQETDVFGATLPIVKHNFLVTDVADLARIIKEAFYVAESGRPGPVLVDIPKDVQEAMLVPDFDEPITLRGYEPYPPLDESRLAEVLDLLDGAQRPMIYCGGGILSSGASDALFEFVERSQVPVASTLMGIGAFPETHSLSLKWLGMHGTVYANNAVNEADVLLALGVRFDDRVTGKVEKFAEHGTIVHIDIDNSEINKNKVVRHPILADVGQALKVLNRLLAKKGRKRVQKNFSRYANWYAQINQWKKAHPLSFAQTEDEIQPQYVIRRLYELTKGEAIITTGVGQHQMWAAQFYDFDRPRTLVTSSGLGSMGYGYPAALGAKVAFPDVPVIDIDGDGSFLMNIQELATAKVEKIAAKAIILNNQHLGMVVQWEDRFFQGNRAHTYLGNPESPDIHYPDYATLCAGFGVTCERITEKSDLDAALRRMLKSKEPYVLDVKVPYTEHVLPMIPAGMTYKDIIVE